MEEGYGNAYADVLVGKPRTEVAMLWESRVAEGELRLIKEFRTNNQKSEYQTLAA